VVLRHLISSQSDHLIQFYLMLSYSILLYLSILFDFILSHLI
jgi:hypothetical protein